jgi:protein SCO1/2
MRRLLPVLAAATLALLAGMLAAWLGGRAPREPAAPPGGDFTLQSADGPVALAALRGKVVLIYFGYASCPDVCPTSLALTAQGLGLLTPQERERVRVLFISVDPARDTPQKLRDYAAHFHPAVTGVTGAPEALAEIAARYGAAYRIQPVESAAGYVVDHSSFTSIVAPDGRLAGRLAHGAQPAEVAAAVRRALRG